MGINIRAQHSKWRGASCARRLQLLRPFARGVAAKRRRVWLNKINNKKRHYAMPNAKKE